MSSSNEKYVVFKAEEFERFMANLKAGHSVVTPAKVEDAVVIRRQDEFAPAALEAYANCIMVAVDLAGSVNANKPNVKRLREIADYFKEQATIAWDTNRKVPD